jgi:hypothetical protein
MDPQLPTWSPCEYLENVFGKDKLDKIPTIYIKSGRTDYLDIVRPIDLVGSRACKGLCPFRRHFLTFHVEMYNEQKEFVRSGIMTLFKRYTDSSCYVVVASHYAPDLRLEFNACFDCSSTVSEKSKQLLTEFFNEGEITLDYEPYCSTVVTKLTFKNTSVKK